jgi:hypothetical protein
VSLLFDQNKEAQPWNRAVEAGLGSGLLFFKSRFSQTQLLDALLKTDMIEEAHSEIGGAAQTTRVPHLIQSLDL